MYMTLEYKVTYKDAPKEPQQFRTFNTKEAAIAYAISVERDGGMAVVTTEHRISPISSARPYSPD
jgi:hypothetical protein